MNRLSSDDDLEVRIPRHNRTDAARAAIEPAAYNPERKKKSYLNQGSFGTPSARDWYFFSVELQTAISAGVPFVRALELVGAGSGRRAVGRAADLILVRIREGAGASSAISNISDIPPLIRNLLIVGLRGGDAPAALRHIISHYGWVLDIRGQVLRVITYPGMLVLCGALVMVLRDVAIAGVTGSMETGDAAITYSIRYFLPIMAGGVAAVILAWLIHLPGIRPGYDRVVLTAPIVGKMILQYSQAVFFRVLALLIEAGMPITDAWLTAIDSVPNSHVGRNLEPGIRYLQDGESLAEALRQTHIMDQESRAMAAVGGTAGTMPGLLRKYSSYREDELRNRVRMLTAVLGFPCLGIIALGYFQNPGWLGALAFLLVFARRVV